MAIILDMQSGGRFYMTYFLDFFSDADREASIRFVDYKKSRERAYLIEVVKAGKHPFWARTLELQRPADMVPKCLTLKKGTELPDYVHESCTGRLVSERLKALIEAVEPADRGFQFFPLDIRLPDNTAYPVRYFAWHVFRKVDAIDPSLGGVKTVSGEPDGRHSWTYIAQGIPRSRKTLGVRKDVIAGMAAWLDYRSHWYNVFIPDALHDAMKAAGITGFRAQSEWSEV